jgi:hypothetical protein
MFTTEKPMQQVRILRLAVSIIPYLVYMSIGNTICAGREERRESYTIFQRNESGAVGMRL